MFKNKYNLIILALGLVFVLGGCLKKDSKTEVKNDKQPVVVDNQQKTDQSTNIDNSKVENSDIDTSDWLIYRNEEYKIEFKYPNYYKDFLHINKQKDVDNGVSVGKSALIYSDDNLSLSLYSKDYTAFMEYPYVGNMDLANLCKKNKQIIENYKSILFSNSLGFCDNIVLNNQNTFYEVVLVYLPECGGVQMEQIAYLNLNNSVYGGLVISKKNKHITNDLNKYYSCTDNNFDKIEIKAKQYLENIIDHKQLDDETKNEVEEFQDILRSFYLLK